MFSLFCPLVHFSHTDAAGAFSDQSWRRSSSFACTVVYFDFERTQDLLVILELCDRIFWGFFTAVILVHPTSSWSRVRHHGNEQRPLRSRARPSGLPGLSPAFNQRIIDSNNALEITAWVSYVTLNNPVRKAFLFLMIPEDFGGHRIAGPASPWDMEELRSLEGVNEAVRGAAFLCRFAAADQKHPVGIMTNLHSLQEDLYLGWPDLSITGDQLAYNGPLTARLSLFSRSSSNHWMFWPCLQLVVGANFDFWFLGSDFPCHS